MNRSLRRSSVMLALLLSGVMLAGALTVRAAPSPGARAPRLAAAMMAPGGVAVSGEGFTAGGQVFVAVYDDWGAMPAATRWTTASAAVYGLDGSQDPARGFVAAGAIRTSIGEPCGSALMARAYDQSANAWSAAVDVAATGSAAVYGPDGSADPALGYHAGC